MSWVNLYDETITGFQYWVGASDKSPDDSGESATDVPDSTKRTTSFTFTGLTGETANKFAIWSVNAHGVSSWLTRVATTDAPAEAADDVALSKRVVELLEVADSTASQKVDAVEAYLSGQTLVAGTAKGNAGSTTSGWLHAALLGLRSGRRAGDQLQHWLPAAAEWTGRSAR